MRAADLCRDVSRCVALGWELLDIDGMRGVGFRRDANCWVPSGCNLLGFVRKDFVSSCAAGFRRDARSWVSLGCELLGFVAQCKLLGFGGMRAAVLRQDTSWMASMRAEGFRPAVHCWVLLGCELGL